MTHDIISDLRASPGARLSDPETSREAAHINRPGRRSQALVILRAYANLRAGTQTGMTAKEVEWRAGVPRCWRRVSDLHKLGLLENVIGTTGRPVRRQHGIASSEALKITDEGRRYLAMIDSGVDE